MAGNRSSHSLQENKINYPIVIGTQDMANEYGGLPSLTMTLLIDRSGRVAESHAGMVNKEQFENKIKQLLEQNSGT